VGETKPSALAVLDVSYFRNILEALQRTFEEVTLVRRDLLTQEYSMTWYTRQREEGERHLPAPVFPKPRVVSAVTRFGWHYLACPLLDLLLAFVGISRAQTRFNVFIATSCYDAVVGLFLRRVHLVGRVVYWAMDWLSLSRFRADLGLGRLLTFALFQHFDRFCAEHCDATWDATSRIARAREARAAMLHSSIRYVRHKVIHPPVLLCRTIEKAQQTGKPTLVLVGRGVKAGQGIDLALDTLPFLIHMGFDARLMVVSGSRTNLTEQERILDYARRRGVEKQVVITGFVPTSKLRGILQGSTVGLSVFRDPNDVSNFAFPGKVVLYLESGLPVIVSKASALARDIEDSQAGVAIDYQKDDFIRAFLQILNHESQYRLGVAKLVKTRLSGEIVEESLRSLVDAT